MNDVLTTGRPIARILRFSLPVLMGSILQQLYNVADAAIVGRFLGPGALAGVGASSSVQFLVLGFCLGLCAGFAVPVAQCFGAEDRDGLRRYVFHAALLGLSIAALLTTACALLCPAILRALSVPADILQDAYRYLLVIFLGIPFTILYNLSASLLRAVGDSRTPFCFLLVSTVLNIVLDLVFVLLLGLGVTGAAGATVLAQALSGGLCLLFIGRHVPILRVERGMCGWDGTVALRLLRMGVPMGLQTSVTAIGSMVMQASNNALGTLYVTAFTAGTRIKQLLLCPFDALATGTATFCSQNLGARRADRIRQGMRQSVAVGVGYGLCAGLAMLLLGRQLAGLLVQGSDIDEVLSAAARYLWALGWFFWMLGILNVIRMSVQGLGYSLRALLSGALEMAARITMCSVAVPRLGFTGICFTDQSAWVCATIYILITVRIVMKRVERDLAQA